MNYITTEQKIKYLNSFSSFFQGHLDYESYIESIGLCAQKVLQEFESGFSENSESHIQYVRELGKESLGSLQGQIPFTHDGEGGVYVSEYLSSLKKGFELDKGMKYQEFRSQRPPAWELEMDESRRNRTKLKKSDTAEFMRLKSLCDAKLFSCNNQGVRVEWHLLKRKPLK